MKYKLREQTSAHRCQVFWFIVKYFVKQIHQFLSLCSSEHSLEHTRVVLNPERQDCLQRRQT